MTPGDATAPGQGVPACTAQGACQIACLQRVAGGTAGGPPLSASRQLKLFVRRHVSPGRERALRLFVDDLLNRFARLRGRASKPASPLAALATHLKAGDVVRVRSQGEIEATLNHWQQLRGCTFMPEMAEYCGTRQRVLKAMERFVDERDLRAKRCQGIVLLEGVLCQGVAVFGRCDRSCHIFWREEWLEKEN